MVLASDTTRIICVQTWVIDGGMSWGNHDPHANAGGKSLLNRLGVGARLAGNLLSR